MVPLVDIVAGTTVLIALALKFKYRWMWATYALACWAYSVLNFMSELPAQGIMNVVAGMVSVNNFLKWKQDGKKEKEIE